MNGAIGRKAAYMLLGVALLAGCDGPIGLDGRAQVDTMVEGGASEEATGHTSNGLSPDTSESSSSGTQAASTATGSVDVRARVLLKSASGVWREATDGFVDTQVSIDGSDGLKLLSQAQLEADEYVRVRIEFELVEADVAGGLMVGVGSLVGKVNVAAGTDGRIVVEREVRFTARARTRTRINIGLNAREWLAAASSTTRLVAESEFRSALLVSAK